MAEEIQIKQKVVEDQLKEAYLDYSMSVIVGRALPDIKDGLKPVHRRILYAMHEMGLQHNKRFTKCAGIVGDCLKKYHPHGDSSVYDALVRLGQEWNLRYPLIIGQGNWGSIDGDPAGAYRYTEAKLNKLSEELLSDIDKDTVDFIPNFDGSLKEPVVLPSKIPNIILNGSSGIAVGMATNIPPHNINEICDAINYYIDNKECSVNELLKFVKGPDFPTGGQIFGSGGIKSSYLSGKGKLIVRAKTHVENDNIVVTEIPYMVNKSMLIEGIADLVRDKRIIGISDIRDESDRSGIRIVIELKKGANPEVLLNQLYSLSSLQTTFGVNMLALVHNEPRILNLKNLIEEFVAHRKEVLTRRTKFDLDKSEERAHVLEGIKIAILNIDSVVQGIKKSENPELARAFLVNTFSLSEMQAKEILEMRLQRLTSLETKKIDQEHSSLLKLIQELKDLLNDENKIYGIIKNDTKEIKERYGDERRTDIIDSEEKIILDEDLINETNVVITVSQSGYIKQVPLDAYKSQLRGGTGIRAANVKEEDVIEQLFVTSNLSQLLFFTNKGKIHWLKAYLVPEAGRYTQGTHLVNLLRLNKDEKVNAILPIKSFDENLQLLFATKKGVLKKTSLKEFDSPRQGGILAIKLKDNDEVVDVKPCESDMQFILGSKNGRAVKFLESNVREVGRSAVGVRGMKIIDDEVVGMEVAPNDAYLLTVTENGRGKRTIIEKYRLINRGGKGVLNLKVTEKTGKVVGIKAVKNNDEVMCITEKGQIIRLNADNIPAIGRHTQGVRLVRLKEDDKVAGVSMVVKSVK